MDIPHKSSFKIGKLVITPGALAAITESGENPWSYVVRHMGSDWGEVDQEDCKLNDAAVKEGTRLLSAYSLKSGVRS